jgi:hypothetical protein
MATLYYGVNTGSTDMATSASTTSKDVQIYIADDSKLTTVNDLIVAIEELKEFVLASGKLW